MGQLMKPSIPDEAIQQRWLAARDALFDDQERYESILKDLLRENISHELRIRVLTLLASSVSSQWEADAHRREAIDWWQEVKKLCGGPAMKYDDFKHRNRDVCAELDDPIGHLPQGDLIDFGDQVPALQEEKTRQGSLSTARRRAPATRRERNPLIQGRRLLTMPETDDRSESKLAVPIRLFLTVNYDARISRLLCLRIRAVPPTFINIEYFILSQRAFGYHSGHNLSRQAMAESALAETSIAQNDKQ